MAIRDEGDRRVVQAQRSAAREQGCSYMEPERKIARQDDESPDTKDVQEQAHSGADLE